jgi:hypothetical protein
MERSLNEGIPDVENAWFIDPGELKIQHEIGHGKYFLECSTKFDIIFILSFNKTMFEFGNNCEINTKLTFFLSFSRCFWQSVQSRVSWS